MKIRDFLIFCFLSALCGGNTGLVSAKLNIYTGAEGGNGTINCYFTLPGSMKFFCKEQCQEGGVLVKTDGVRANNGRYSLEYTEGSSGRHTLQMTITHLIKSDSGRYRCGLGKALVPDSYAEFEIRVSDELDKNSGLVQTVTEGENITYGCRADVFTSRIFFCKNQCEREEDILIDTSNVKAQSGRYSIEYKDGSVIRLSVTITTVTKSDIGWYRCGYGRPSSPDSFLRFQVLVVDAPIPSTATAMTTQSLSSTSSSASPVTTEHFYGSSCVPHPVYFLPLVVCVSLVSVSLLVVLLWFLYKLKTNRN